MDRLCLTDKALALLRKLTPLVRDYNAVLAGGTALAIRLSHRYSTDFDFFTNEEFRVQDVLSAIKKLGLKHEVQLARDNTFTTIFPESKFSLFWYPYRFLETDVFEGVKVAGILDIASMKIAAITQRGVKRDFVDLYYILQDIPFRKAAAAVKAKYGTTISSLTIGKALVFFSEADESPDPAYISGGPEWKTVKRFFEKNVRQFVLDLEAGYADAATD